MNQNQDSKPTMNQNQASIETQNSISQSANPSINSNPSSDSDTPNAMSSAPKEVLKPWGKEIWFAHNEKYAGKILHVSKGHRYSLQYHEKKQETQYLYAGQIKFIHGDSEDNLQETIMNPGDKIDVNPPLIHRVEAIEDSIIIEVSTPELDDVVKLHDDYGRTGKGNNLEQDAQLHSAQNSNQSQP